MWSWRCDKLEWICWRQFAPPPEFPIAFPKNEILSRVFLLRETWILIITVAGLEEFLAVYRRNEGMFSPSLKGIEVVVGICMGTGKIRATLMITQKKESPWLILLKGDYIAVWWFSFWWFFAQITYCSVAAAIVLLPRLLEGEEGGENGLLLERAAKTYTKMSCRHSMLQAIV